MTVRALMAERTIHSDAAGVRDGLRIACA